MPEVDDPMQIGRPVHADVGRARRVLLGLWLPAWSLVTGVALFVISLPAGLHQDDLLNLQLHRAAESPTDMLLAPVFLTQLAPGFQALTALQLWLGPTDRVIIHGLMAALGAGSVWVTGLIYRRIAGPSLTVPVLLALVVAGPGGVAVVLWYAAAYHFMPSLFLGLLGVFLFLRWRGSVTGPLPRGAPVLSPVVVGLGMLFSLKGAIAALFIVLLEYVLLRRGDLETVILGLWKDRLVWSTYGLLLLVYVAMTQRSGLSPEMGELSVVAGAVISGLLRMTAPMLLGLGSAELDYTPPDFPGWLFAVAWAVVAAGAMLVARRGPVAQRGLAIGGLMLVAGLVLTAGPRTTFLGESAAFAQRYHLEGVVYFVLAVSLGASLQARDSAAADVPGTASRRRRLARAALVVAALSIVGAATVWSNASRVASAPSIASGRWIAAIETALKDDASPRRVLDANVPKDVLWVVPGSRVAILDGLVPGLDVVDTDPDAVLTPAGTVEPLETTELFADTGSGFAGNALVVFDEAPLSVDDRACAAEALRFQLPVAPHPAPRLLAVRTTDEVALTVEFIPIEGRAREPAVRAQGGGPGQELVVPMDLLGWVQAIDVTARSTSDEPACVTSVRILQVENRLPTRDPDAP